MWEKTFCDGRPFLGSEIFGCNEISLAEKHFGPSGHRYANLLEMP